MCREQARDVARRALRTAPPARTQEEHAAGAVRDHARRRRQPPGARRSRTAGERVALEADERGDVGPRLAVGQDHAFAAPLRVDIEMDPEPRWPLEAKRQEIGRQPDPSRCGVEWLGRRGHHRFRQRCRGPAIGLERVARVRLRRQVVAVERRRWGDERRGTGDGRARGDERSHLLRVVGEQDQPGADAQQRSERRHLVVAPDVRAETHLGVGLEGREALAARLYQHAIARLGGEPRAASLLQQVEDDAASGVRDPGECGVELFRAVAVAAAERFAGHARRMDASEERRGRRDVARGEGDGRRARDRAPRHEDAEGAVCGRERHRGPGSCFNVRIVSKYATSPSSCASVRSGWAGMLP